MKDSLFNERVPVQCSSDAVSSILTCDITLENDTLQIKLIDTNDIFKFYQCTITGTSYVHLKNEQELRVNFENFVRKVIELFYQSKNGRMKALFDKDSDRFIFVEQNEFRNIVRLELRFKVPDENDYKRYLADMISRMEVTGVKLRKENVQLKESLRNLENEMGTRVADLTGRNRVLDERLCRIKSKMESVEKENDSLVGEREELKKRMVEIEKENSTYKFEIEKKKIEEYKKEQEFLRLKEVEECKNGLEKEVKVANDIIRKLRDDLKRQNESKEDMSETIERFKDENEKLMKSNEDTKKNAKEKEDKIRGLKENLKRKDEKIKNLEMDKKQLIKKMEEAKFVYNHFYKKREGEISSVSESQNSTFSVHPESPPR